MYTHNKTSLGHKENEIMSFAATWIDLKIIILSEIRQMNLYTKQEQTHTDVYKIDNQQGPAIQHRELYSIFCNNL